MDVITSIEIAPSNPTEPAAGVVNVKDKVAVELLAALVIKVADACPLPLLAVLLTPVEAYKI